MRSLFYRFTYIFILIAITQCSTLHLFAQPPAPQLVDSLQNALSKSQSEKQRIKLLTRLSEIIFGTKPEKGRLLGLEAIDIAKKAGLRLEEGEARVALAACLWGLGQHLQAIDQYRLAIPVAEQSGNRRLQARIQHGIAINYGAIDKKEQAISFLKKSLDLQLKDANDSGAMGCYHNMAHYSNEQGNKLSALQYNQQALIYAKRAKHARGIAYTHMLLGAQEAELNNLVKGISLLKTAEAQFQSMHDTSGMAECWAMQGQINEQRKRYEEAIFCYQNAIRLQRKINGQYFQKVLSGYLMNLANVYQQKPQKPGSFANTRNALTESLKIASATKDWNAGAQSALALSQLYRKNGQPLLALEYYENHIEKRDSFLNIEKEKERNRFELQTMYNDSLAVIKKLQEKQLTIARQEKALLQAGIVQTRLYALVGLVLLAMVFIILLYRNRLQKLRFRNEWQQSQQELATRSATLEKQIREATLSALQAQMNPHFIFNSLNVIQSFVYSGEKELSSHLIGKFSDLVRQTFQFSRSSLITLEEELSFIRNYTDLEIHRMGPDLSIQFDIQPHINLKQVHLPPLLIQPYVENALRHGLYHKEGKRWLSIAVEEHNTAIRIKIEDNGVGRDGAKAISLESEHLSFASGANAERMKLLNQLNNLILDIQIIDKSTADGAPDGTMVLIYILPTINRVNTWT
jgi:tetratricopeptide (TPR) repeat protein